MNKLVGTDKHGNQFLMLILEPGNLAKLQQNSPIRVDVGEFFPDGIPKRLNLLIAFSDTPVADAREIRKMSEMVFDERKPVIESKRPHCPECKSTIEQLGAWKSDAPIAMVFCVNCGCAFGTFNPKDLPGATKA